jgi:hypothetical protein
VNRLEEAAVPRLRILLIAALVAVLLSSGPAVAGGPTSVLLSVPGEGKTASLYFTDPEYDALAALVGVSAGVGAVDKSGATHERGPGVTLTWLIHDVTPWRVDHVYLEGEGAPWIATPVAGDNDSIWDSPVVWHQPEDGAALGALLDDLGVGKASRAAGEFHGVAGAPATTPTPAEPAAASSRMPGVWWGLVGVLAGVLGSVLWVRFRPSRLGLRQARESLS